jgi:hypothetical protein
MYILKGGGFSLCIPAQGGYPAIGNFIAAGVDGFGFPGIGAEDNFSFNLLECPLASILDAYNN